MDEVRFGRRLLVWQAGLAALGSIAWLALKGSNFALSFLFGAAISSASFWLLHRVVFMSGPGQSTGFAAVLGAVRLALIGTFVFAILRSYELQRGAAATGILVVITSILLEVVREYFHGT